MNQSNYVVWNLRTGESKTRKTKPKKEELEASEVVAEARLEVLSDDELKGSTTEEESEEEDPLFEEESDEEGDEDEN